MVATGADDRSGQGGRLVPLRAERSPGLSYALRLGRRPVGPLVVVEEYPCRGVGVLMLPEAKGFAHSGLLGRRAEHVYAWFLKSLHLPGDVAECGVFHGETSRELVKYLEGHGSPKTVHLFDTFAGLPDAITAEERSLSAGEEMAVGRYACSAETVRARLGAFASTGCTWASSRTPSPPSRSRSASSMPTPISTGRRWTSSGSPIAAWSAAGRSSSMTTTTNSSPG
ncbi:MAG: TylF/MycF family methyltransferase [Chloroflexota bacterium]|nr:TylF/MycF family methyltransferase [Chloroflexota bacterium]